jgi:hypothetical protein
MGAGHASDHGRHRALALRGVREHRVVCPDRQQPNSSSLADHPPSNEGKRLSCSH